MAMEMRRGKVAFLWDLGSGSTRLEYPDLSINNNKWHRIHATRYGCVKYYGCDTIIHITQANGTAQT